MQWLTLILDFQWLLNELGFSNYVIQLGQFFIHNHEKEEILPTFSFQLNFQSGSYCQLFVGGIKYNVNLIFSYKVVVEDLASQNSD